MGLGKREGKVGFCSIFVFVTTFKKKTTSLEFGPYIQKLYTFAIEMTLEGTSNGIQNEFLSFSSIGCCQSLCIAVIQDKMR